MMHRCHSLLLAVALVVLSAAHALGALVPPVVTIRKVTVKYSPYSSINGEVHTLRVAGQQPHGPVMYPLLDEPAVASDFLNFRCKGRPSQRTELRLGYDNDNLYVMFTCREAQMDKLATSITEKNGPVWRDDSVEILLDPFRDGSGVYHLVANAKGVQFGKLGEANQFDIPWVVKTELQAGSWTASATIPFGGMALGQMEKPGEVWRANFGRHEMRLGELSSWSPVTGQFMEPEHFGEIVFGNEDSLVASISVPEIPTPGKYPAVVRLSNPTKTAMPVRMDVLIDGKVTGQAKLSATPGDSAYDVAFDYPPDGRHVLSIAVTDARSGKIISRTAPISLDIAPNMSRLDRFREIARGLSPKSPALQKELAQLKKSLGALVAFSQGAKGSTEMWRMFGEKLDAVEPAVARLRYACSDTQGAGYVVGAETPLRKLLRDRMYDGQLGGTAEISAARNEYEAAQVVVIPWKQDLKGVSVSVSALKGSAGTIPADRVSLNLVGYVKTRKPRYDVDYIGWWPDPLMDMKPFDVTKGSLQPVWVTVHPPEDTPAGVYKGEIVVKPQNAPTTRMPLEVRVRDFTLPKTPALKTAFALFVDEVAAWYGGYTDDVRRDYYTFLLEHRINPTNIYSHRPMPEKPDLPFCVDGGLNAFCLACTYNQDEEGRTELAAMIRDYEGFLKEKGWWDKAYIYGFDEIPREKYGELKDMYGWVKKEFPDLPRMCTVVPNQELRGYVDIWVPLTANYDIKKAQEYTRAGDQVWWYVCCNPHHPYPNFFIDYPALDQRVIFWQAWKYRVPGFLYYAINLWQSNRSVLDEPGNSRAPEDPKVREAIKAGKRWPEVPWNTYTFDDFNGDGVLIYPGPNRKPLSSIRFECIRDGIEDYDCLRILSDLVDRDGKSGRKVDPALVARAKKLLSVDEVARAPDEYSQDPAVLLKARQDVAETIEKFQSALR